MEHVPLGEARAPVDQVQDYLDRETRPVPAYLRDDSYVYLGSADLPVSRWLSRDFFEREMRHVWPHVWQLACVADDVATVGDYVTYDIGDHSFIVVREAADSIRAYYNSCLHRATKLATGQGHARAFKCPFHGWVYGLNGRITGLPCAWDFEHLTDRTLPEIRVATWQGLVFVCMDPAAPSLADYIGPIDAAFERYPLTAKHKSAHVEKVVPGNWKIGLEQFIESYHVFGTHPEALPYIGDANTEYCIWPDNDHVSRMHALHSVSSPHVGDRYSQQDMMDLITAISDKAGADAERIVVPDGVTTRQILGEKRRRLLADLGLDVSHLTDAEMIDTIHYFIFPNIVVWTAYGSPMIYRFRPNGMDHESHVMEVIFLTPYDARAPKPAPAPVTKLGYEQSWTEAPELGKLGWVFDQDVGNAHLVLAGLKASGKKTVTLANYQEVRIRHYHRTIDKYIERGEAE
ncbi:aromatic ring-hydroxylating oxygenase subunit alpha [Sphingomonas profundi]|uniref:aromatic ring-hydroxylating oxygenase subunit alpha n=1 Tax=Alterirhizorhabdus profundi TaxID=2681549 RepID=UPI0018D03E07|nr:aromatic ring-hydroxylating dioxygenase subunit alpha [Sphingomonas profundi]